MKTVIGIDVGTSTTKIVGLRNGEVISPIRIRATDPVTSLYGAFGKYLHDNSIQLKEVEQVMLTGVGSAYVNEPIYGLPTRKAEEFIADGLGARYESKQDRMLVVSMGTGTSFVQVDGDQIRHIGGMGIGGGTLKGLSQLLLGTDDIKHVAHLAENGNIANVNLQIGDISAVPLPGLPLDATASIFGNVKTTASQEDIAAGLICTVVQTIGSATYLSSLGIGIKDFVMIGNLTLLPQCKLIFPEMEKLYGVRYIIPKYSEFCTAIGAALCYTKS
ncbi:MAG: type II pantothenate kinase [Prevotella sp.]|nr:type II pantothenate kinase [Prevotella sp.]